ncbi:MAG: transferase [Candidatus Altiarchaeales archaeon]|nr:transferase [Candidatus Altiarchaeales archaeon]MBD3417313.1 transferase [Candidatus Altiarchaeales archaeon]
MEQAETVKRKESRSHGDGSFSLEDFSSIGKNVVIECGVLAFHPENIDLGENVYIGHNTILKGYHNNRMIIGDSTWIGQCCFLHSGGGLTIGEEVGIAPRVNILTAQHREGERSAPIRFCDLEYEPVKIERGCDIGIGAIILPGVTVGEGSIVGAGSVVTKDVPPYTVFAGNPAKKLRDRN